MKTRMSPESGIKSTVSQRDRFIETAHQLGADEDEAAFKAKLATIAKQKPKDEPKEDNDKEHSRD